MHDTCCGVGILIHRGDIWPFLGSVLPGLSSLSLCTWRLTCCCQMLGWKEQGRMAKTGSEDSLCLSPAIAMLCPPSPPLGEADAMPPPNTCPCLYGTHSLLYYSFFLLTQTPLCLALPFYPNLLLWWKDNPRSSLSVNVAWEPALLEEENGTKSL